MTGEIVVTLLDYVAKGEGTWTNLLVKVFVEFTLDTFMKDS